MKKFKLLNFLIMLCLLFSTQIFAAGFIASTVQYVSVRYGNGCIELSSGEMIKVDITTDAGKAEYATALTAMASGKRLIVYQNDNALVDGCNTGPTIKPHSMLNLSE